MTNRRQFIAASAAFSLSASFAESSAYAQTPYPSKPIRWIVPSPAGSPVDSVARTLGESLSKRLGVPVIVDNKPGAIGSIGAAEVARASPDGYTFLFTVGDPLIGALAMLKSLPYDPRTDFTFISKVMSSGLILVAHPSVRANSLTDLVTDLKATGAPMTYGSWGPGTLPMQVMESMARQAGVKLIEVPYKGSPPALQDVLGNQVSMTITAPSVAAPLIAGGKLKPLAVIARRSSLLPNVPTFAEAGFTGFVFTNPIWVGLLGPAKLNSTVRDRMAVAVRASLGEPALQKFLADGSFLPIGSTPAEFEKEYRAEIAVIPKLLHDLGVVPQ